MEPKKWINLENKQLRNISFLQGHVLGIGVIMMNKTNRFSALQELTT